MSEYQYYEFQTIDRRLSSSQMAKLRACSSRANITPTSFVNEYHWGDFRGDEKAWMTDYLDAFLYLANWGSRKFALRVSSKLLRLADVRPYRAPSAFSFWVHDSSVVFWFESQDEDGDCECETDGILSSLIPIRDELMRGDYRALYLGWLGALQMGELGSDDTEPPVPPGLGELSDAQEALVDFLRIDDDLLTIAAEMSLPITSAVEPTEKEVIGWLAKQPATDRDGWLAEALFRGSAPILAEVHRRFREDMGRAAEARPQRNLRTAEQLLNAAEERADERERIAEQEAAERAERIRIDEEFRRDSYLNGLVGQDNRLWTEVENLVKTKQPLKTDAAVQLICDLRDLATRTGNNDFVRRLEEFRTTHARKPSLLERIAKAGF